MFRWGKHKLLIWNKIITTLTYLFRLHKLNRPANEFLNIWIHYDTNKNKVISYKRVLMKGIAVETLASLL